MKEFTFKEQTLVQMWTNETFTIEAETYEEAKKIFIEAYLDDRQHHYSEHDYEYLYETQEYVKNELLDENENVIDISND